MEGDSVREVVSSNPSTGYWMDISSQLFYVKSQILFEKTKNVNEA